MMLRDTENVARHGTCNMTCTILRYLKNVDQLNSENGCQYSLPLLGANNRFGYVISALDSDTRCWHFILTLNSKPDSDTWLRFTILILNSDTRLLHSIPTLGFLHWILTLDSNLDSGTWFQLLISTLESNTWFQQSVLTVDFTTIFRWSLPTLDADTRCRHSTPILYFDTRFWRLNPALDSDIWYRHLIPTIPTLDSGTRFRLNSHMLHSHFLIRAIKTNVPNEGLLYFVSFFRLPHNEKNRVLNCDFLYWCWILVPLLIEPGTSWIKQNLVRRS